MGGINFSPVMNLWLQRRQTWKLVRRRLKGKIIGKKNNSYVSELGTYRMGLGRWCWINMKGNNGYIWWIVCTYQPCGKPITSHMGLGTVYVQQRIYFIVIGETGYPIMLFRG